MTLLCLLLFGIAFTFKTVELLAKGDPDLNMIESESNYDGVNLYDLGFMFAIESFDPRIGKISMETRSWDINGNKTRDKTQMVDCASLLGK